MSWVEDCRALRGYAETTAEIGDGLVGLLEDGVARSGVGVVARHEAHLYFVEIRQQPSAGSGTAAL